MDLAYSLSGGWLTDAAAPAPSVRAEAWCGLQVCTLSSLLPLSLLGLVPNTTGAEELQRKADEDAAEQ